ncbi:hypothetical protein FACS1894187_03270 [Synergistales bacterium]|nr:hypothetical protein FACS1894187_03270 [Synergistales bacterium]
MTIIETTRRKLFECRLRTIPIRDEYIEFTYTPSTIYEFMLYCFDCFVECITKKPSRYACSATIKRFRKKYGLRVVEAMESFAAEIKDMSKASRDTGMYMLKDAILPCLSYNSDFSLYSVSGVFKDTFLVYMKYDDCYDEPIIDALFEVLPEGPYGLRNDAVNVTVEAGDIVIDAGSWIGDFAAYASAKGATTYAFEPDDANYEILMATADFNNGIYPVKKGLGDIKTTVTFVGDGSTGGKIVSRETENSQPGSVQFVEIETTTIDDFVEENGLDRVDFIKADIEGYERYMLKGAAKTLKKFAPKLALCTYHLPDDPEVMEKLIKEANPAYNVIQKRKKLFASVPN